jgi:hypothetical protein
MNKYRLMPDDLIPTPLSVKLEKHIVEDLKSMEKNTNIKVDELVRKAVLMFIATHNDYLGRRS